jgi:hypothetical protein
MGEPARAENIAEFSCNEVTFGLGFLSGSSLLLWGGPRLGLE